MHQISHNYQITIKTRQEGWNWKCKTIKLSKQSQTVYFVSAWCHINLFTVKNKTNTKPNKKSKSDLKKTNTHPPNFLAKCCYYCSQTKASAHTIPFPFQRPSRGEQRSPATRKPVHQVLTEVDLQQLDHKFIQPLHTVASLNFSCYS